MTGSIVSSLEKLYSNLSKGNLEASAQDLPDTMTFNVAGKSLLAGKYSKETFFKGYVTKLHELSGGTLKVEVHDVLASERHATVLLTYSLSRKEQSAQLRSVHVWRIENAKLIAGYEYPRDMYLYDSVWS